MSEWTPEMEAELGWWAEHPDADVRHVPNVLVAATAALAEIDRLRKRLHTGCRCADCAARANEELRRALGGPNR